ncbi:hypothetical protein AGOR_G00187380 [Albula goreensis]|uniref:Protein kinase domain-containing protein n=1 Tax=Albula goreensis TaxID=1534307 RepID=A0A8T3D1G3_9TELE|nr:hypothetical protein AGOR_G00187380 [Albula goreensis]
MDRSVCSAPVLIGGSSLQSWSEIGSGGFGQIYKAKHKEWRMDVAIKLLHHDDSCFSSLHKEVELMRQGGSPFVLRVLGVYRGTPPGFGVDRHGLVMEFMERGSVEVLLERLGAPPPWPLAFRLAHQVALGMNFLHHLSPPLLHLDLKPSNVLLDDGLTAKLTDFGLARLVRSVSSVGGAEREGGTLSYMPPEAFSLSYKPTAASDCYSYAILLWSIITGKQPYRDAISCIVRLRVPEGDRPSLEVVDRSKAEGLGDITDLMVKCWNPSPHKRPCFRECLPVTEKVFELHKRGINDAVHQVLTVLETDVSSRLAALNISAAGSQCSGEVKSPDHVKTVPPPAQGAARNMTSKYKAKDPFSHSANHTLSASRSSSSLENLCMGTSRSSPCSTGGLMISMSDVTGVQVGNNNTMIVNQRPRRRNPTAPPAFPHVHCIPSLQPDKALQ